VAAVVAARHADPFSVLGPHSVGEGAYEIRAMLPGANAASVVPDAGGDPVRMTLIDPAGFYVGRVPAAERPGYRLRIEWPGATQETRDPYSYGPIPGFEEMWRIRDVGSDAASRLLGAHPVTVGDEAGFFFAVWAPNARRVSVIGDFNGWDGRRHPMRLNHDGGVWELFVPGLRAGERYKYEVLGADGSRLEKADPVAFAAEKPPATASRLYVEPDGVWRDEAWMKARTEGDQRKKPISVYECHLGSWARVPEEGNRYLTYRELADRLIPYVRDLGFSHIELLPITEYPFDGSWGYQPVSMFAPTSRFGTPEDFVGFVEAAHEAGIGIILDWVPGHFPNDPHGLGLFDGTHLYEHADPRQGYHQDWGTYIYNFGRQEVTAFLVANARWWLERYHLDGLRVDAVASMLYLDYSRKAGEWVPNRYGGNENLDAIDFMRRMNEAVYANDPGTMTIAEESTSWRGVSHPTYTGGLGFGFKWNMGWMHDTLTFISKEPVHRRYHHHNLTFGLLLRVFRKLHAAALARRGRSRERLAHQQNAGRPVAAIRQSARLLRVHVGASRQEASIHGRRVRPGAGVEPRQEPRLALLEDTYHRGSRNMIGDLNRAFPTIPALHGATRHASGFQWLAATTPRTQ
jgi:1,4-alpha-glucan branching enzyme